MATVADLIRDALEDLGVLAASETPSAADEASAFRKLNRMLDSWAGERLNLWATLRSLHTLTASLVSHDIGTGASSGINTTRPVKIERASLVFSTGGETPLDMLSDAEWQALQGKTSTGQPSKLWVETSYPFARLWFYPRPDAAYILALYTWQQIGQFAATTTDVELPPGYERAIISNLAAELAPSFGAQVSRELEAIAAESKANIRRLNFKPGYLTSDSAFLGRGPFNFVTGE